MTGQRIAESIRECVIIPPRPSRFPRHLGGTSTELNTRIKWHRSCKEKKLMWLIAICFRFRNRGRHHRHHRYTSSPSLLSSLIHAPRLRTTRWIDDLSWSDLSRPSRKRKGGEFSGRDRDRGSDRGLTFSVSADLRAPATSRNRTGATATTGHL